MGSTLLPQALCLMSRNPTQCLPQKLGFCTSSVSFRSSFSNSSVLFSSSKLRNRSLFVRAESEASEDTESSVAVAENEEGEEEAVVEPEPEIAKRKPIVKLGDIMGILNKQAIDASVSVRPIPDLRSGDIVEIKLEVPENRRRLSIYKGIVISKQNAGVHTTIRIRRIIAGIGVEIVFPIYSPNVKEIKVVKHRKVRRARLYYLRDKLPRLSTFK
ncbi:50S ribosomal protein L19-1, chloroplastic [Heracleum sosnowskyi]|uniref:50S ribosomal protein L19-1, chloroplastic n=1 Tax=Heracleum sosnowskyi TaxID=360622 RepID=A0AAD8HYM3_9APIA|nr:50S ribosomal protein L19-1, chloroplastic [Heracleum sosnowskyi]